MVDTKEEKGDEKMEYETLLKRVQRVDKDILKSESELCLSITPLDWVVDCYGYLWLIENPKELGALTVFKKRDENKMSLVDSFSVLCAYLRDNGVSEIFIAKNGKRKLQGFRKYIPDDLITESVVGTFIKI